MKQVKASYPELDQAVYDWFLEIQHPFGKCKPLPLSRSVIQARAKKEAEDRGIITFQASNGWFRGWLWRFEIGKSVRLNGGAGDLDLAEAETRMNELRRQLAACGYSKDNIFNMDETGLFYRCLPNRSYVCKGGDGRQMGRGTKAMKAKDRITLVLCCNATGTCKVGPLVIGSAKNPHCFRNASCPLPYVDQPKAWVDKERYRFWWKTVFLPRIREFTKEKVALIMDSCSGHDKQCVDETGQVQVFYFPPNSTSVYQPLDQGIIAALKTRYKTKMLEKLVSVFDDYEKLQEIV